MTRPAVRVAHVITGLGQGGAEMMLYKLLTRLPGLGVESRVLTLQPGGALVPAVRALGVEVTEGDLRHDGPWRGIARARRWLAADRPDVVQTWMYHADLVGGVAARLDGLSSVAWNIQAGWLDPATTKWSTRAIIRLAALASRWVPTRVVCCGRRTLDLHREAGYAADILQLIPNAADLDAFRPDPAARASVLAELGLPSDAQLIGQFARFHPQKDHRTLVGAAGRVAAQNRRAHFLLCGTGVDASNAEIAGWVRATGYGDQIHLLGPRQDVPRLAAALDLACLSSSFGEGLPNVLVEAMACGVPCAATDVGDAAWVVGDTGRIVPPGQPEALATAIAALLDEPDAERAARRRAARARVERDFNLDRSAEAYASLYRQLAARRGV
jgi:glycosyltransferase involved in cell wall biosynthesis